MRLSQLKINYFTWVDKLNLIFLHYREIYLNFLTDNINTEKKYKSISTNRDYKTIFF